MLNDGDDVLTFLPGWILRVVAPAELVNYVSLHQRSGDMIVGSCGLVAILA